jgi:hypothetical protein
VRKSSKGKGAAPTKTTIKLKLFIGTALKRWQKEKWKDVRTGKPCGSKIKTEYCRPTKKVFINVHHPLVRRLGVLQVSSKTPKMRPGKAKVKSNYARKAAGLRAKRA